MKLFIGFLIDNQRTEKALEPKPGKDSGFILGRLDREMKTATAQPPPDLALPHVDKHWSRNHIRLDWEQDAWYLTLLSSQPTYLIPAGKEQDESSFITLVKGERNKVEAPCSVRCSESSIELRPERVLAPLVVDPGATIPLPLPGPKKPTPNVMGPIKVKRQDTIDIDASISKDSPPRERQPTIPVDPGAKSGAEIDAAYSVILDKGNEADRQARQARKHADGAFAHCATITDSLKQLREHARSISTLHRPEEINQLLRNANKEERNAGRACDTAKAEAALAKQHAREALDAVSKAEEAHLQIKDAYAHRAALEDKLTRASARLELVREVEVKANSTLRDATSHGEKAASEYAECSQILVQITTTLKNQEQDKKEKYFRRTQRGARIRNWVILIAVFVLAMVLGVTVAASLHRLRGG